MNILFNSIDAIFSVFLVYKFLNLKLDKRSIIIFIISIIEFISVNKLTLIICFIVSSVYLLHTIYKLEIIDVFLFSLLTIAIYLCSGLIKNSILPNWGLTIFNYFERTVIYLFFVIIFSEAFCKKNNQFMKKDMVISLSFGCLSIILIIMFFVKMSLGNNLNSLEISLGSCSAFFMCYMLLKYYKLFNDSCDEIDLSNKKNLKYKYRLMSQSEVSIIYKKSKQMNHHIKYILLNIELYLKNKKYQEAINYINNNLYRIEENQTIFTDNHFFDYILNKFDNSLNNMSLTCTKSINISQNSYFNHYKYCEKINTFFEYQLNLIKQISPRTMGLIINEKGDFLIIKILYYDYDKIENDIECDYTVDNNMLVTSLILDKLAQSNDKI